MNRFGKALLTLLLITSMALEGCAPLPTATAQSAGTTAPASPSATPAASPQPSATPEKKKQVLILKVDSKAIANNLGGEETTREVWVLLPPSYYTSDKRYPVVYYITGFGMSPGSMVSQAYSTFPSAMKPDDEFILVEIDAASRYGGSFLVNSAVTGNWEDYAIDEIIPYIDSSFRTVAESKARGIAGFSMGGFAAVNLAFRHPDVFCAAYALCPGLLEDGGLKEAMKTWQGDASFLTAYGQAFCPLPAQAGTFTAIPKLDGSEADAKIVKKWESGFGDLQQKIDSYLALGKPLKSIAIEYAKADQYTWIPKGCVSFSNLLDAKHIRHTLKSNAGGHGVPPNFATEELLPFFSEAFKN